MYVITVEFVIKSDCVERFRRRVARQARDSLEREPNCRTFDVCADPEQPNRFVLYEVYGSGADFEAHLRSEHFQAFASAVADWVIEKRVRELTRIEPSVTP